MKNELNEIMIDLCWEANEAQDEQRKAELFSIAERLYKLLQRCELMEIAPGLSSTEFVNEN